MSSITNRKKGTTDFIANAVEERLRMNIEFIDSWHRALALHASPRNAPEALHNIGTLVDHIWYHAGDRSYDVSIVIFLPHVECSSLCKLGCP